MHAMRNLDFANGTDANEVLFKSGTFGHGQMNKIGKFRSEKVY